MKKFLALFFALLFIFATAYAGNGVYVPGFQSFMGAFFEYAYNIDDEMTEDILEKCKDGDIWIAPDGDRLFGGYNGIILTIKESNGYLNSIDISIDKDLYQKREEDFKKYILSAAKAILPHEQDDFWEDFFDLIQYSYTVDSPAGYIVMYTNCDLYLVTITKTSSEVSVEISLSLYSPN